MSSRGLLLLALLALGATFFTYRYLGGLTKSKPTEPTETVVVAATRIPARSRITKEMVTLKRVPRRYIHPEARRSLGQVVGKVTQAEVLAGEQVLASRLVEPGREPTLAFAIPEGMRAVTVAVNEVIGVAGFVKPGDRVDVLGTFAAEDAGEETTTVVLQGVEVLAVAQERRGMETGKEEKAKVATTVTLAVTPREAEKLTLAEERGRLRLALRAVTDRGKAALAPVRVRDLLPRPAGRPAAGTRRESAPPAVRPRLLKPTTTSSPSPPPRPKPRFIEVIEGSNRRLVPIE